MRLVNRTLLNHYRHHAPRHELGHMHFENQTPIDFETSSSWSVSLRNIGCRFEYHSDTVGPLNATDRLDCWTEDAVFHPAAGRAICRWCDSIS